jgi:putative endonuclease
MNTWKWFVYIIQCLDGTYYTGRTWDISLREEQHKLGKGSKYTIKHGFKDLVYWEEFESFESAQKREKQIKKWSQEKKQNLIKGKWKRDW